MFIVPPTVLPLRSPDIVAGAQLLRQRHPSVLPITEAKPRGAREALAQRWPWGAGFLRLHKWSWEHDPSARLQEIRNAVMLNVLASITSMFTSVSRKV